ncbi:class I SAM-dependent methyltransferase [bacterium]|nr:class I SAM-dependent methyltransferase [bacterium]
MYDQARIMDILATPGTAAEADVLERIYRCFGPPGAPGRSSTVCLEAACGTGRYLRVLAGRGWRVLGFDSSAAMIAYARDTLRRRGLSRRAHVFRARLADFSSFVTPGSVHLAFIPDNSLRHLGSDREGLAHFEGVARCLVPGGLYVVGLSA